MIDFRLFLCLIRTWICSETSSARLIWGNVGLDCLNCFAPLFLRSPELQMASIEVTCKCFDSDNDAELPTVFDPCPVFKSLHPMLNNWILQWASWTFPSCKGRDKHFLCNTHLLLSKDWLLRSYYYQYHVLYFLLAQEGIKQRLCAYNWVFLRVRRSSYCSVEKIQL